MADSKIAMYVILFVMLVVLTVLGYYLLHDFSSTQKLFAEDRKKSDLLEAEREKKAIAESTPGWF